MSKVKICGLSRTEDIAAVNEVLPDFVGFVFAPSRRRVDFHTAAMLKVNLDLRVKTVGVFVNEIVDTVVQIYRHRLIDLVQLHGDEDDEYIRRLKDLCGCPVIKVICVGDSPPALPPENDCLRDFLIFDTISASARRGGTGKAFDWNMVKHYREKPYFLAGGISADNVADAVGLLSPFCVDVSSGVETDGVKDADKIAEFVRIVREVNDENR